MPSCCLGIDCAFLATVTSPTHRARAWSQFLAARQDARARGFSGTRRESHGDCCATPVRMTCGIGVSGAGGVLRRRSRLRRWRGRPARGDAELVEAEAEGAFAEAEDLGGAALVAAGQDERLDED